MSSKSSQENRLPFEPRQNKKKKAKKTAVTTENPAKKPSTSKSQKSAYDSKNASLSAIPEEVSKRMIRRMAIFSGIPTAMGIISFFIFYVIVSKELLEVPTSAVVFVSMGLFGLGVLGLSYGILSTSWDTGRVGGRWGFEEFKTNFGRMTSAWKSARQEALEKKTQTENGE